jgi:hypothetical protein
MSKLKELELVAYERADNSDPKLKRRRKLLDKLQEQMQLAEDSSYQPMTKKWVTDTDGERKRVEVPKRLKQWWGKDANGNIVLTIRYGSRLRLFQRSGLLNYSCRSEATSFFVPSS